MISIHAIIWPKNVSSGHLIFKILLVWWPGLRFFTHKIKGSLKHLNNNVKIINSSSKTGTPTT